VPISLYTGGNRVMLLRPQVQWFAEQMERTLRAKDGERGGNSWTDANPASLFKHLETEMLCAGRVTLPSAQHTIADPSLWR